MSQTIQSPPKTYTVEEFWDYGHLPENAGLQLELVKGEIVEKNEATQLSSVIGGRIAYIFNQYVIPQDCGYITGPTAYYALSKKDFVCPDIAYISKEKHPVLSGDFFQTSPELAIEIINKTTNAVQLKEKISAYSSGGVRVVWEVYPKLKSVNVMYYPARTGRTFKENDIIECSMILPGFEVKVSDIFPK